MSLKCRICGKRAYSEYCMQHKRRQYINPRGKEYERWTGFRDETAIPYLNEKFGHKCRCCGKDKKLDIDHINSKGSHPQLKYQLSNLQYLCRSCHINKTANLECNHEDN